VCAHVHTYSYHPGMRRNRIDLRVTDDEKARWMALAEKLGLDLSELIRQSVEKFQVPKPAKH